MQTITGCDRASGNDRTRERKGEKQMSISTLVYLNVHLSGMMRDLVWYDKSGIWAARA